MFARIFTDCLMYPVENDDISKKGNIFLKVFYKCLLLICLLQIE